MIYTKEIEEELTKYQRKYLEIILEKIGSAENFTELEKIESWIDLKIQSSEEYSTFCDELYGLKKLVGIKGFSELGNKEFYGNLNRVIEKVN